MKWLRFCLVTLSSVALFMINPKFKLCFVNAKVGLGLTFDLFKQSNENGVINSFSIAKKSNSPVTIQRGQ